MAQTIVPRRVFFHARPLRHIAPLFALLSCTTTEPDAGGYFEVAGSVRSSAGAGISGAEVQARTYAPQCGSGSLIQSRASRTNARGEFKIPLGADISACVEVTSVNEQGQVVRASRNYAVVPIGQTLAGFDLSFSTQRP